MIRLIGSDRFDSLHQMSVHWTSQAGTAEEYKSTLSAGHAECDGWYGISDDEW